MEKITTGKTGTGGTSDSSRWEIAPAMTCAPHYAFEPQEDITAYELAKCLPYMFGRQYSTPPERIMRHFKRIDP